MLTESSGAMKPVAVIIVGADALLAARPASPIQLWHACGAAGYDLAVPATWGDELIAAECLRTMGAQHEPVAVMCTCPKVARLIADMPFDLSGHLVSTVAPPVAAAKYLRRVYGDRRVHITYAGACPAAADSAIDAWITPQELLDRFRETEIVIEEQPELFESILPPDRRRHLSQPGGLPTTDQAAKITRPRRVEQLDDVDVVEAIERHLSSSVRTLIDLAPRVGCACSGALADVAPADVGPADVRAAVTVLEPPRSSRPVMADPGGLGLSRRLPVRLPAATTQPPARPQASFGPPPIAKPERERPAAVATRAPTLSPLSWHLRERAHPQPPTTARPEHRRSPESTRAAGASSGAWASGASPDRAEEKASAPDPVTAAAVRALELAAAMRADAESPARDSGAPHAATSADAGAASRSSVTEPAPVAEVRAPLTDLERGTAELPAREPGTVAGQGAAEPRPPRATPPGGYWFAAPIVAPGADNEVSRPSTAVDAVPDDVGSSANLEAADEHPELPDATREATSDSAPTAAATDHGNTSSIASPGAGAWESSSARATDGPGSSHQVESPRDDDRDAQPPTPPANPGEQSNAASATDVEPADDTPAAPTQDAVPETGLPDDRPPEDVRAELAELFGLSDGSAASSAELPPVLPPVLPPELPHESANWLPPGPPSEPSAVPAPITAASTDPVIATTPTRVPSPTGSSARQQIVAGPLSWKWLVGAALLVVAAVAITRGINARVTTEESGMSALPGSGAAPRGLRTPDTVPTAAPESPTTRRGDSAPQAAAGRAAPNRPRVRSSGTPVRTPPRVSESIPANADTPASTAVTAPVVPAPARADTAIPDSLTQREIELQAIRNELAQRTARLDSMGRALGSLYVTPRRPSPGVPLRPPAPPPTFRDPRG